MSWLNVLILALVQGITEFLPVSSSGHLVVFQSLLDFKESPVPFDVILHVGTLIAVLIFFKDDLWQLFRGLLRKDKNSISVIILIFLGTIPSVIFGFLLEKQIGATFNSLKINGWLFLLNALLLFSTLLFPKATRQLSQLGWKDALVVGLFQAISILPAISRSGATITAGLWRKIDQRAAFRFSFYLSIPAILGALVLQLPKLDMSLSGNWQQYLVGMIVAGVSGFFSLKLLESVLKSAKFYWFGFYCLILGLILLFI